MDSSEDDAVADRLLAMLREEDFPPEVRRAVAALRAGQPDPVLDQLRQSLDDEYTDC